MSEGARPAPVRLAVESLVIIASILAAFALDTWWDRMQGRAEERETLVALAAEFQAARSEIVARRVNQGRILASVTAVTDSLNHALLGGRRDIVLPDTMLALAYIPPTTSLGLGTLQGMIGSGRLGIITLLAAVDSILALIETDLTG